MDEAREFSGMTVAEICAALGMPAPQVSFVPAITMEPICGCGHDRERHSECERCRIGDLASLDYDLAHNDEPCRDCSCTNFAT